MASAIDQNVDHMKNINDGSQVGKIYDKYNQLHYISIDWNRNSHEILDDIIKKFKIAEECNSIITFYLTFPSYPKNNSLLNYFNNFQKKITSTVQ